MKNKMIKNLVTFALCVGMVAAMAGCGNKAGKDTTSMQEETKTEASDTEEKSSDGADTSSDKLEKAITISGTAYSGQARVTATINPDGTASVDANGTQVDGTWKYSDDDTCYIVAHFESQGQTVDLEITKDSDGNYSAPFESVPGMVLTGK